MDDRAHKALLRSSPQVLSKVIQEFKPAREGDDDYSALVNCVVNKVQQQVRHAKAHQWQAAHTVADAKQKATADATTAGSMACGSEGSDLKAGGWVQCKTCRKHGWLQKLPARHEQCSHCRRSDGGSSGRKTYLI